MSQFNHLNESPNASLTSNQSHMLSLYSDSDTTIALSERIKSMIPSSVIFAAISFGIYTYWRSSTLSEKKTKETTRIEIDDRFKQNKKPSKEEKRQAKELYKNRKPKPIQEVLSKEKLDLLNNKQACLSVGKELSSILNERRYINQKRWNCMSRPQYKYSCGISSLTSVWNYLFSTLGEGILPPITQEEVLQILGFTEPFEKIRFGPFSSNQNILVWFRELLKAFNCNGSSSIFWKKKGIGTTIPEGDIREELKKGIRGKRTAFIYHCYNHYMVLIGYEESSEIPCKILEKELEKTNLWFLIGDNSRLQEPVESVKFTDIEKDLNQEGPNFFNVRHPEKGIQKKGTKSKGNVDCIMKFTYDTIEVKIPIEKRTKFDKSRKQSFELEWAQK